MRRAARLPFITASATSERPAAKLKLAVQRTMSTDLIGLPHRIIFQSHSVAIDYSVESPHSLRCFDLRRDPKTALLDLDFTHTVFLNFSGHRHRKRIHEPDVLWNFVVRNPLAAKLANLIFSGTVLQADPSRNGFAQLCIGNTEHLNVSDARMRI